MYCNNQPNPISIVKMNASKLLDRLFIKKPRFRRLVTKLLFGDKNRQIELCGSDFTVNSLSENGYVRAWRSARNSSLLRDELPVVLNLVALSADSDAFVDVGANIGFYSTIMSRFVRIRKTPFNIYAFEVDPYTFNRLSINADKHGFSAFNVGISDHVGDEEFIRGAVSHVTTTIENTNDYSIPGAVFKAKCAPLSAFDIVGNKMIIKIDVEGQEFPVLLGCESYIEQNRVLAIYIDGFVDWRVPEFLTERGFLLLDGRSLNVVHPAPFSLLAIRADSHLIP